MSGKRGGGSTGAQLPILLLLIAILPPIIATALQIRRAVPPETREWVLFAAVFSVGGVALFALVRLRHLTEAREARMHRELEASGARFRTMATAVQDAMLIMDSEGLIAFWNPAATRIFGWAEEEALGRPLHDVLAPPTHRESYRAAAAAFRESGTGPAVGRVQELEALHRDGSVFPVELSLASVRAEDSWQAVGIIRDISLRKEHERDLQRVRDRLAGILNTAVTAIFTVDRHDKITGVNPEFCRLTGYTEAEALGLDIRVLEGAEYPTIRGPMIHGGAEVVRERQSTVRAKSGRIIRVLENAAALQNVAGGEPEVVESLLDITELVAAQQEALAASRAKSAFLGTMSHELRTPLNAILGLSGLLAEADLPQGERENVLLIIQAGEQLLAILENVLEFASIESGSGDPVHAPFELRQLVDEIVARYATEAEERGLRLARFVDIAVPDRLEGDAPRLRRVLSILTGNALRFTPEGSIQLRVDLVRVEEDLLTARFTVVDTGLGIPSTARSSVFDSFTQADGSSTRRHGGAGLGLGIASKLVEAMGGTLSVDSEEGQGSRFRFDLTLHQFAACGRGDDVTGPPDRQQRLPASSARVLLVEDNRLTRQVTARVLEKAGHRVEEAESVRLALDALAMRPFDLVLMDLEMREFEGYEATTEIRRIPNGCGEIPVIGLIAHVCPEEQRLCLEAGMACSLSKPIRTDELLSTVNRWAGREVPVTADYGGCNGRGDSSD